MIMSPQEMREAIAEERRLNVEQSIVTMISQMMTGLRFTGQVVIECSTELDVHDAKAQATSILEDVVKAGWFVKFTENAEYNKGHVYRRYLVVSVKDTA